MNLCKNILCMLLFFFPIVSFGTTVRQSSVQELFNESSIVAFGRIETGHTLPENCGIEYSVRVVNSYKGKFKVGDLVTFKKYGPMQIGANYFLFMSEQENNFEPLTSSNSFAEDGKREYFKKCHKYEPAYVVNVWGEGAFPSSGTYNKNLSKAVFFDDFMFSVPKELNMTKLRETERYDNDQRYTAVDLVKFENYLKKLSTSN